MSISLSLSWEKMMRGRVFGQYHYVAESCDDTDILGRALGDMIVSIQTDNEAYRLFKLGLVGGHQMGKTYFSNQIIKAGGDFALELETSHDQVIGDSPRLGRVVRADTNQAVGRHQVIAGVRSPLRVWWRHANTEKGLDIIEHADTSRRSDFHLIVRIRRDPIFRHVRNFEIVVPEKLEKTRSFQRFLGRIEPLAAKSAEDQEESMAFWLPPKPVKRPRKPKQP